MATDPCVEAEELRAIYRDLVTGKAVSETRFGEDMVRFTRADLPEVRRLLADAEARCLEAQGKRVRRRYAMPARFRPY